MVKKAAERESAVETEHAPLLSKDATATTGLSSPTVPPAKLASRISPPTSITSVWSKYSAEVEHARLEAKMGDESR